VMLRLLLNSLVILALAVSVLWLAAIVWGAP
jgi:hypothetical protein